jgi:hypothetical protein
MKTVAMTFALATELLVSGALAQHEQHHSDQPFPPVEKNKMMTPGMAQMMTTQQEVNTLANQLLKSFATIENEKDPTVLQKKLAEHGALIKELLAQLQGQSQMMEKMLGDMRTGHMMGGE